MIKEHNKKDPKKEREKKLEYAKQYARTKAQEKKKTQEILDSLSSMKKNKILDYLRNVVLPTIERM